MTRITEATPIEELIDRYREIIESIETQSCKHGPNGTIRVGENWRDCCGVSYEYLNDIFVRNLIEKAKQANRLSHEQSKELDALDLRLKSLLLKNGVDVSGPEFWKGGLPFGIKP
jgi:hypothetical protein